MNHYINYGPRQYGRTKQFIHVVADIFQKDINAHIVCNSEARANQILGVLTYTYGIKDLEVEERKEPKAGELSGTGHMDRHNFYDPEFTALGYDQSIPFMRFKYRNPLWVIKRKDNEPK